MATNINFGKAKSYLCREAKKFVYKICNTPSRGIDARFKEGFKEILKKFLFTELSLNGAGNQSCIGLTVR